MEEEAIKRRMFFRLMRKVAKRPSLPRGVLTLNASNFRETLSRYALVVVDFWAEWCAPCRAFAPIFEEIAKRHSGKAVFARLNVDEASDVAYEEGIMSIPTVVVYYKGKEYRRFVGFDPASLQVLERTLRELERTS